MNLAVFLFIGQGGGQKLTTMWLPKEILRRNIGKCQEFGSGVMNKTRVVRFLLYFTVTC